MNALISDEVQELIHSGAGELAIERAIRATTPSIRDDGFSKVLAGDDF